MLFLKVRIFQIPVKILPYLIPLVALASAAYPRLHKRLLRSEALQAAEAATAQSHLSSATAT
jgi:hypothetical protein